jgi:hypothetical protein
MKTHFGVLSIWLLAFGLCLVAGESVKASFVFGEPVNLGPVINTSINEAGAGLSPDSLALMFARNVSWTGVYETWLAMRPTKDDPWTAPVSLGRSFESYLESVKAIPSINAAMGLELYFSDNEIRPGGYGSLDLWMMTRETIDANWESAVNLGPTVNTTGDEMWPILSPDGLELYFSGYSCELARAGGQGCADLWVMRRATRNDPWGAPQNLGPKINSASGDARPSLSADGLVLFFDSERSGYGQGDLYMVRRATLADPWGEPVNLGPLINTSAYEECASLSPDGSTLFFDCGRPGGQGGHDIWQAPVLPIVDFTGEGKVDGKEILVMIEDWGTSNPLCDIGPTPMGDGMVDTRDLAVLAEYMGKDINDPTLIAHWALDETEGTAAHDSAGANDAIVMGNAVWQPDGKIGGALGFDGVDDFMRTGSVVLDPSKGPFSVFAWVKGGAPGQVVISQQKAANWLMADASQGFLMTELKSGGRFTGALRSQTVITDGDWHRVGLVWDGSNRTLYVDDVQVARDTDTNLLGANTVLYIGAAKGLSPATFWSGLIDDVRIYNRAVQP